MSIDLLRKRPRIRTPLPGPKARLLIEKDKTYLSPSTTRYYPLVAETGRGCWLRDPDGNIFLDFTAGIAVNATGHCHPRITRAVRHQVRKLMHMSGTDFYYEPQVALAERLAKRAPGKTPKKVFFTNSGTESVEAAFKLARYRTGRERMISFFGSFHGRTFGSLSLTASKTIQREKFGTLVPGVVHVDYGSSVDYIEETLFRRTVPPEEVAAVIAEPIQGEGGIVEPPADFFEKLRRLTEEHGILLIIDEVQAGMGRTGKLFAIEHWGIEPDIICLAKGIASGMPLGAMIAREDVMIWRPGSHASTFGGNPVSCAAALATLDLLEGGLIENAGRQGEYLKNELLKLQRRYEFIGEVRGRGLLLGIEFVKDSVSKEGAPDLRDQLVEKAFLKGLLVLGCGDSAIRFTPPLVVTRSEIDTAIEILALCLKDIGKQRTAA